MPNELRELIEKLRSEVVDVTDNDAKERLNKIIAELEKQVGNTDDDDGVMENLGEFVDDSIVHFETGHPAVTETINRISSILSGLGI